MAEQISLPLIGLAKGYGTVTVSRMGRRSGGQNVAKVWPKGGTTVHGELETLEFRPVGHMAPIPLRIVSPVRRSLARYKGPPRAPIMEHDGIRGARIAPIFFWDFFCWPLEPEPQALSVTRTRTRFPCDQGEDFLFHSNEEKNHCLGHDLRQLFVFLQGHARYLAA